MQNVRIAVKDDHCNLFEYNWLLFEYPKMGPKGHLQLMTKNEQF